VKTCQSSAATVSHTQQHHVAFTRQPPVYNDTTRLRCYCSPYVSYCLITRISLQFTWLYSHSECCCHFSDVEFSNWKTWNFKDE